MFDLFIYLLPKIMQKRLREKGVHSGNRKPGLETWEKEGY